jgi:hypothetical protein
VNQSDQASFNTFVFLSSFPAIKRYLGGKTAKRIPKAEKQILFIFNKLVFYEKKKILS